MYNGFVRVAAAVPKLKVADCDYNVGEMIQIVEQAEKESVQVVCFPELSITAYTCADLFLQQQLLKKAELALKQFLEASVAFNPVLLVGMPLRVGSTLFNVAVVLQNGKLLGAIPKTYIPNNNEYYEKRWFASGERAVKNIHLLNQTVPFGTNILFSDGSFSFAIEICEDLWAPIPPSSQHCMHGAEIIFNLSASNELVGKSSYRQQLIEQQSARSYCGYVYASSGVGESTTDLVFAGNAYLAEDGKILSHAKPFQLESQLLVGEIDVELLRGERLRNSNFDKAKSQEEYLLVNFEPAKHEEFSLNRIVKKHPFVPSGLNLDARSEEIISIQAFGLAKRWQHTHAERLVIGISGGLDSTLALLVCVKTADLLSFDRKRILGITMPGFGTTGRTYNNALSLMQHLGIEQEEISIEKACLLHFEDIKHDPAKHDVTYENVQARERTQILMDIANQRQGIVVGTGDLSESALGWATYNGDHMSMYAVNSGVPKTLVRYLVRWFSEKMDKEVGAVLNDILDTPVSPELYPVGKNGEITQKTEDILGAYELHDFFLYYFVRFGFSSDKIFFLAKEAFAGDYADEEIEKSLKLFLKRFFSQQFKRSCMPDGPKVGTINLSPRGDWRMPSDAVAFQLIDNKR